MLTPIEIHNKQHKQGRGYSKKEMDEFLERIAEDYETIYKENREMKEKLEKLSDGIQYYKSMEGTLQKALVLAEKTSKDTIDSANKKAELIENEARFKAGKIISHGKDTYEAVRQQCLALIQQYNQFKLQFKQIAIKQIELFDSDFYEIYTNDFMNKLNETIDTADITADQVSREPDGEDASEALHKVPDGEDTSEALHKVPDGEDASENLHEVHDEENASGILSVSLDDDTEKCRKSDADMAVKPDMYSETGADDDLGDTKEIPVIRHNNEVRHGDNADTLNDIIPTDDNFKKAGQTSDKVKKGKRPETAKNKAEAAGDDNDEVDSFIRELRSELSANVAEATEPGSGFEFLDSDNL